MKMIPCYICGEMPTIEKISNTWWNADHEVCDGEPGVSIANAPSADRAVEKWNKWQVKIASGKAAVIRVGESRRTKHAVDRAIALIDRQTWLQPPLPLM
jgi:hypothetical protein